MDDQQPLGSVDEWEDFVVDVYSDPSKRKDDYRNYDDPGRDTVREFYRLNHRFQTLDFAQQQREKYAALDRKSLRVWDALEWLNTLVDDSDPDIELSQIHHLFQTAEAIRAANLPDWFVLTGLIHDLGKVLCLFGEPQWAVVGDTFPLGCAFSDKIIYAEFFADNPDSQDPRYQTRHGIYEPNCGLRNVTMSWGHDEYLYHVVKPYLPEPALYIIRYHSFYAQHREEAYDHLLDDHDRKMFASVRAFNPFDLYTKSPEVPNIQQLRPYYEDLIAKYLPDTLKL